LSAAIDRSFARAFAELDRLIVEADARAEAQRRSPKASLIAAAAAMRDASSALEKRSREEARASPCRRKRRTRPA